MKIIITLIAVISLLGFEGVANAKSMPVAASTTISTAAPQSKLQNRHITRHHLRHRPHRHIIPQH
jgi:hypothetical protein